MKLIYITCNISMLEQMEAVLREMAIKVFQIIPRAQAESDFDIPHKDNAIWPGFNACIIIQEQDVEKAEALLHKVQDMNEKAYNNSELISAYMWEIQAFAPVKPVKPIEKADEIKNEEENND